MSLWRNNVISHHTISDCFFVCLLSLLGYLFACLCQNGADIYHADARGHTVLDLCLLSPAAAAAEMQPFGEMTSHILKGFY